MLSAGHWHCTRDKSITPNTCNIAQDSVISYSQNILPLVNRSCGAGTDCHGAGASFQPVINDYASVKAAVDNNSLQFHMFEIMDMPPSYGADSTQINECERELFRLWVQQGAPNN
jgi:hypothetical protein